MQEDNGQWKSAQQLTDWFEPRVGCKDCVHPLGLPSLQALCYGPTMHSNRRTKCPLWSGSGGRGPVATEEGQGIPPESTSPLITMEEKPCEGRTRMAAVRTQVKTHCSVEREWTWETTQFYSLRRDRLPAESTTTAEGGVEEGEGHSPDTQEHGACRRLRLGQNSDLLLSP